MLDIAPLGDRALTIRLGDTMDPALAALARGVASRLRTLPGVQEAVPGYATVTVFYASAAGDSTSVSAADSKSDSTGDSTSVSAADYASIRAAVEEALSQATAKPASCAEHIIPVRYDGPDLDDVARRTGLTPSEVIARHAAGVYTVYLIGFVPGFAYLGDLDPALELPRRDAPRTRVPAGSVAIAGRQTAVYPLDTPGGWHLIGHTNVTMFDPMADPPATLAAGDRVRFVPTST